MVTNNLPATEVTNVTYQEAVWGCERVSVVWLHFCLFPQIKGNLEHLLVDINNFGGHMTTRVK